MHIRIKLTWKIIAIYQNENYFMIGLLKLFLVGASLKFYC